MLDVAIANWPQEHHYWLENAFFVSQIILLLIAGISAEYARRHLKHIDVTRRDGVRVARATFLLEIDRRWDSEKMMDSRRNFTEFLEEAKSVVSVGNPVLADGAKTELAGKECLKRLAELRAAKDDKYYSLMRICGFFETAGLMVKQKYISIDEIMGLFRGPICDMQICFTGHIAERQKETGVPAGMYEHALYLCSLL